MKNCYLVTSIIEVDNSNELKKGQIRSVLTTEERYNDTIKTIDSILAIEPNAKIFLLEASKTYYTALLIKYPTLEYIHLESTSPDIANTVRTTKSKSYGESIMILDFLKSHKSVIAEYDHLIKLVGRYYIVNDYLKDLSENTVDKFIFKSPVYWNKQDLGYLPEYFLPHDMYVDNKLGGYYTVAHAVGKNQLDRYELILYTCASMANEYSKYFYVDLEYLIYRTFNLFNLKNDVLEVDWVVEGRGGQNGKYFRY
jgi:hypothetical protein